MELPVLAASDGDDVGLVEDLAELVMEAQTRGNLIVALVTGRVDAGRCLSTPGTSSSSGSTVGRGL